MGLGLGALVDDSAGGVDGVPYLQFVVPGIVATQAMWVALGESTYQVLGYIKWNMGYHAMLATPLRCRATSSVGHLLSVAVHLTVATTIFMAVAALFGGFSSWWALLVAAHRGAHRHGLRRADLRASPPGRRATTASTSSSAGS